MGVSASTSIPFEVFHYYQQHKVDTSANYVFPFVELSIFIRSNLLVKSYISALYVKEKE